MSVDSVCFERGIVGSVALPGKVRASVKSLCPPGVRAFEVENRQVLLCCSGEVNTQLKHRILSAFVQVGEQAGSVVLFRQSQHTVKTPHSPGVPLVGNRKVLSCHSDKVWHLCEKPSFPRRFNLTVAVVVDLIGVLN